jgi:hypothetical protein
LWDPEAEIALFSSVALLDSPSSSEEGISSSRSTTPDSPVSVHGSDTDINDTICNSTPSLVPFPSDIDCDSDTDTTLAYFCDHHNFLFHSASSDDISLDAKRPCRTQASSTLDGLDVYAKGSLINGVHPRVTKYSCLNLLDRDFTFNPCTSFVRLLESRGVDEEVGVDMDDGEPPKFMKRIGNVMDDFRMVSSVLQSRPLILTMKLDNILTSPSTFSRDYGRSIFALVEDPPSTYAHAFSHYFPRVSILYPSTAS